MATYSDYLTNLATQKATMVTNMNTMFTSIGGLPTATFADEDETLNSLVAKIPAYKALKFIGAGAFTDTYSL